MLKVIQFDILSRAHLFDFQIWLFLCCCSGFVFQWIIFRTETGLFDVLAYRVYCVVICVYYFDWAQIQLAGANPFDLAVSGARWLIRYGVCTAFIMFASQVWRCWCTFRSSGHERQKNTSWSWRIEWTLQLWRFWSRGFFVEGEISETANTCEFQGLPRARTCFSEAPLHR